MTDLLLVDFARKDLDGFAAALSQGGYDELIDVLERLPADLAVAVSARLPNRLLNELVRGEFQRFVVWLDAADLDEAAALIGRLPRERGFALANALTNDKRSRRLLQFLHYPSHCIGAVVRTLAVQVPEQATVAEVLAELHDVGGDLEVPAVVLDATGGFRGKLNLWKLLLKAGRGGHASDYVLPVPTLRPETNLGNARDLSYWNAHLWLPVVDYENRVLGYVSHERIVAAAAEFDDTGSLLANSVEDVSNQFFRVSGDLLTSLLTDRRMS